MMQIDIMIHCGDYYCTPDDSGFAAHNLTILNIKSKTLCQAAETI